MWPNPQFLADLLTFTEEILNGKHHFLCSDNRQSIYVSDEADKQTYLALDPSNFDALQTGRWQCVSKADSTMKKTISSKCRWKWGSDPKANSRQKYFDVGDSIRPSAIDKSPEAFNDKINC